MNILLYTFRTFPLSILSKYGLEETFRFGKLHEDLLKFEDIITCKKPEAIVGFSLGHISRQELTAVNRFNNGCIDKNGKSEINLTQLDSSPFKNSTSPTHTFCNWTMYKLAQNHSTSFFHLCEKDFDKFASWISS